MQTIFETEPRWTVGISDGLIHRLIASSWVEANAPAGWGPSDRVELLGAAREMGQAIRARMVEDLRNAR